MGDNGIPTDPFRLHEESGERGYRVEPASQGGLFGALMLLSFGATGAILGAIGTPIAFSSDSNDTFGSDEWKGASLGLLLGGSAMIGGGIGLGYASAAEADPISNDMSR